MKKVVVLAISLVVFFSASIGVEAGSDLYTIRSIEIVAFQQNGTFVFESAKISCGKGVYMIKNIYEKNQYYGQVISQENEALAYFPSKAPMGIVFWDDFDPKAKIRGGVKVISGGKAKVRVPYFPNAERIELLDPEGKILLTVPMSAVR